MNERAEELYERARELHGEERAIFLADACGDDAELLTELSSLLAHSDKAEGFFTRLEDVVLPAIAADPVIGETVGHYRVLSHLGSGGMGTVYRAQDVRLNREVALKFLPPYVSARAKAADQMLAEARAAAALQHPNICVVHDIGESEDRRPFIAMALCDGETLKQKLARGPLGIDEAVAVAEQIARGLAAAHARRIIHRDVKPGNVMIDSDGTVKLLDFGLAAIMDASTTGSSTTQGTIAYMSPEQVRGDSTDERGDLWALGVVMCEMLLGRRPFRGENDRAIVSSILNDSPPPLERERPGVPASLARIVERLLAKNPDARYQNASALLTDLSARQLSQKAERPSRGSRVVAWAFGAVVIAGISVAAFMLTADRARTSPSNPSQFDRVSQRRGLTRNIAAYELYLRGRDPVHFRSDSGALEGLALLKQAVALDPGFAAAYAAMTLSYVQQSRVANRERIHEIKRMADSTAQLALELDSLLPEAHIAAGVSRMGFMQNVKEAEASFRRAIELGGAPRVHEYLARSLSWSGRPAEALEESYRAVAVDPLSAAAAADLGEALCANGRYDEGLARLAVVANVKPPLRRAKRFTGMCYALKGAWPEAVVEFHAAGDVIWGGLLGFALARSGDLGGARRVEADLLEQWKKKNRGAFELAVVAAGFRNYDAAFTWLDSARNDLSVRGEIMLPMFADLHRDPRFARVAEQFGIQRR